MIPFCFFSKSIAKVANAPTAPATIRATASPQVCQYPIKVSLKVSGGNTSIVKFALVVI